LGELVFVDLVKNGEIKKGGVLGALESVKIAADLYSPIDGTINKIND
jgi:glycine cleavage system H protein